MDEFLVVEGEVVLKTGHFAEFRDLPPSHTAQTSNEALSVSEYHQETYMSLEIKSTWCLYSCMK